MTGMAAVPDPGPAGAQLEHGGHVALDAGPGRRRPPVRCRRAGSRTPRRTSGPEPRITTDPDVGVAFGVGHRLEQLADATGGERVVPRRPVEGQPAHRRRCSFGDATGRVRDCSSDGAPDVGAVPSARRPVRARRFIDLAGGVAGQERRRSAAAGAPCSRPVARAGTAQVGGGRVGAVLQHDPGFHIFPEDIVGDTGHRRLDHVRVGEEHFFDLARSDVVAAPDDQVLGAPGDPQEAVVVEVAEVAAEQPAVPPGLPGRLGFLVVLARRPGPPDGDLARSVPAATSAPSSSTIRTSIAGKRASRPTPGGAPLSPDGERVTAPNSVRP